MTKTTISTKTTSLTLVSALALAGFSGCAGFDPWDDLEPETPVRATPGTNALGASAPVANGEIGGVQALGEHVVWEATTFDDPYYGEQTYIEIRTQSDEGVTMQGLTLHVGVADLEPGDSFDSNGSDPDREVDLLGCSGENHGFLDYETTPDELHVEVEEGPTDDTLRLDWEATLPTDDFVSTGSEECSGSVVISRQ